MSFDGNYKCSLKKLISDNQGISTTTSKLKPQLVKDIMQSFKKDNSTDRTQKKRVYPSKISESFSKVHTLCEAKYCEGSSKKYEYKRSKVESTVNDNTKTKKLQKTGMNKMINSSVKVKSDQFTMTTPYCNHSKSKELSEMHNLNIHKEPCNCINTTQFSNNCAPKANFDSTNTIGIFQNIVTELKLFLEQSIKAQEDQTSKLRQILNSVNSINNTLNNNDTNNNDFSPSNIEGNVSEAAAANIKDLGRNLNSLTLNEDKNCSEESTQFAEITEQRLSPLIKLVNNDTNQEVNHLSMDYFDIPNKTVNENQIGYWNTSSPKTPNSQKASRRRTIAAGSTEFQGRRRSLSTPESDLTQCSFTMLEKKLNIVHKKLTVTPSPTSPMCVTSSTPTFAKHWDERGKRSVKEYMELKAKSTFLVTPTVNWYQSRLESTDTDIY